MLRQLAKRSFGVETAEDPTIGSLVDVTNEAEENATQLVAAFRVEYGKQANTYAKAEYDSALMAYGRVLAFDGGEGLFQKAVTDLTDLVELLASDDAVEDAEQVGIRGIYNGNLLVKRIVDVCAQHRGQVQKERENKELLETLDDGESPISQTAAKKLAQLTTEQQAAYIVQMIARLPLPGTVFGKVKELGVQLNLADPKAETAPAQEAAE
jgi:hypothetical protein